MELWAIAMTVNKRIKINSKLMPKTTFTVSRTMSDDKWLVTQQGVRLQRVPFGEGRVSGHAQIERWPTHFDLLKLI